MRVEILSLSLLPEARVARDSSVARLFVEYSLLDLPTQETPLSLPKPPQGKNINYNYSKGEAAATAPSSRRSRGPFSGAGSQNQRCSFNSRPSGRGEQRQQAAAAEDGPGGAQPSDGEVT